MESLLSLENLFTLMMLILLQAVLGFDNLLYISIESGRVTPARQKYVRWVGIILAIILRLILMVVVLGLINSLTKPLFAATIDGIFEASFTFHSLVSLAGGGFIMYTATKEIMHLLAVEHVENLDEDHEKSVPVAIATIVFMNLIFSFDSLLSAIALTHVVWVIAAAIIISGLMMIALADQVSVFLKKNRMFEVIGLFILFIVGVLLISEGGHLAHMMLFGFEVVAMSKASFYFVIFVMVVVSTVQSRYRNKLEKLRAKEHGQTA
ncbi:TerC family protein [Hyphococcus luteus]|uniref:Tellurium resistance protein TerC n=1 Tax=Hyphococcus luteus TaxID=2058213 RepID=A0A2S7KAT1_9PROT|nr:tellurium resistance protein TerC [Marinicaulis flavus]PQA89612.1 tellurium resistance protein TerC [Marinicaulis flavus]